MNDDAANRTDVDELLIALIKTVEGAGGGYGVTLSVGGMLVSGILTGGQQFFAELSDQMKVDAPSGSLNEYASVKLAAIAEGYAARAEARRNSDPGGKATEGNSVTYIHLRETRIFGPSGQCIPTNAGVLWRGRLSCIDGFFMGTISVDEPA